MSDPSSADRPKAKSVRPLASLLPFLKPYRSVLAWAMVALLLASGSMLALPVALKHLVDRGMSAGDADTIDIYFITFLGVAVLFGAFAAMRFNLVTWLG